MSEPLSTQLNNLFGKSHPGLDRAALDLEERVAELEGINAQQEESLALYRVKFHE